MDFKEIVDEMKERIPIVDVLLHYRVRLYRSKKNEEYAFCACPLPTHPKDDKGNNSFNWHIPTNRWRCYHDDCKMRGDNWGDCINLVMALDRISFTAARKKLEGWFPNKNPALHIVVPEEGRGKTPHPHILEFTSSAIAGKGYMHETGLWLDEILTPIIPEEVLRKALRKALLDRLHQSYLNGKSGR